MTHDIKAGSILIKENTPLPKGLEFKSEICVPGWKIVTDFEGHGLDREISNVGWNFFCTAGEIRASVFGTDAQHMIRRAVVRIRKDPKLEPFNSLEITQVESVGSRRFPGIWYVTVSARLRHIQQGLFLCAEERPGLNGAKNDILNQPAGIADGTTARPGETKQLDAAPILSL